MRVMLTGHGQRRSDMSHWRDGTVRTDAGSAAQRNSVQRRAPPGVERPHRPQLNMEVRPRLRKPEIRAPVRLQHWVGPPGSDVSEPNGDPEGD